jgi:hypothetical protein
MNRDTNNYELHMQVNFEFNKKPEDVSNGEKKVHQKFTPGLQSERLRVIVFPYYFSYEKITVVRNGSPWLGSLGGI